MSELGGHRSVIFSICRLYRTQSWPVIMALRLACREIT